MGIADPLKGIIAEQKGLLARLEAEQRALENSDPVRENDMLKAELETLRADLERKNVQTDNLTEDNRALKAALYEQIYSEKLKIIQLMSQKTELYFSKGMSGELDKLTDLELRVRRRIDSIRDTMARHHLETQFELSMKLDELCALLDRAVTRARAKGEAMSGAFTQQERDELNALREEPLNDGQIRAAMKKNNMERFVGLNILNAVGVFLLLIGAITLAQFTYSRLDNQLRGILLFALGGGMLAAGELLNRKKPTVFSLGISAGGVGILYAALAASYFALHILEMLPALAVCVLITAVAFLLSHRYHSQTIASFALIGGYLPMFSLGGGEVIAYGAMVYFIALNLLAFFLSFSRKWRVSSFIGLTLNILGTAYLCFHFYGQDSAMSRTLTILYVLFAFLIYTFIPIFSTLRTKGTFTIPDIVLLGINTVFSCFILYGVFYLYGLSGYNGALAVAFAAVYLALGGLVEKKFSDKERNARALFYLTGLAFVILMIPMQFGRAWVSLGWLAEGVSLAAYGILRNEKRFRQTGLAICSLCLAAFVLIDCAAPQSALFVYKYLAVTAGSLVLLGSYMVIRATAGRFAHYFKYAVMGNLWLFFQYLILSKLSALLFSLYAESDGLSLSYLANAASVAVTFALAYLYPRIKLLYDQGTKLISIILHLAGIVWLLLVNSSFSPLPGGFFGAGTPLGISLTGTVLLAALALLSVAALRDVMKILVLERRLGVEWYPLVLSGYFVVILTQNLVAQYQLSFTSVLISVIYVLTALAWILYGFARRFSSVRLFGLGLALLAVIKLFLVDLASLTQGYQILSYFTLGITLIAISFVYQHFNKRLERKEEEPADAAEQDH